jgi:hypothetical protein
MDHEHVHGEADELGSELSEALEAFFGPAHLKAEVLSFHIAQVAQPVPEFFEVPESRFIGLVKVAKDTDPWDLLAWLRLDDQRRHKDAQDKRDHVSSGTAPQDGRSMSAARMASLTVDTADIGVHRIPFAAEAA